MLSFLQADCCQPSCGGVAGLPGQRFQGPCDTLTVSSWTTVTPGAVLSLTLCGRVLNLLENNIHPIAEGIAVDLLSVRFSCLVYPGLPQAFKPRRTRSCASVLHSLSVCALLWKVRAERESCNPHERELWNMHLMACCQWLSISSGVQISTF